MPERGDQPHSRDKTSGEPHSREAASDETHPREAAKERQRARLAERLRVNLQRRKAQSRARRAGEADERPDGLLHGDDAPQE